MNSKQIKKPSSEEVAKYLKIWDNIDNMYLQQNSK